MINIIHATDLYTVRRFEAFVEFLARIDTLETQEKE